MDWKAFYTEHPLAVDRADHLTQVGHTVAGQPISSHHLSLMVADLRGLLEFQLDDSLLDLCCGNGLITSDLAKSVARVTGVDFSEPLLAIATEDHLADNVTYVRADVLRLDGRGIEGAPFDKVLMHGALQHFTPAQLPRLLETIRELSDGRVHAVFGFVPDRRRKRRLYDTPRKRIAHLVRRMRDTERMGTWWDEEAVVDTADRLGLRATFHEVNPELHASRYRRNIRIVSVAREPGP